MKAIKATMLMGIAVFFLAASVTNASAQEKQKVKNNEDIFVVVEEMPEFQNGDIKTFQNSMLIAFNLWINDPESYKKPQFLEPRTIIVELIKKLKSAYNNLFI